MNFICSLTRPAAASLFAWQGKFGYFSESTAGFISDNTENLKGFEMVL